jgi:uncharacterized protein YndB with AHSA1/START domain
MTEKNFNNDSFFHSIYLNASLSNVYKIVATSSGLEKWFMGNAEYTDNLGKTRPAAVTAEKGDVFSWHWLEKDLSINGKVLESVNNEKFSFTFGPLFEVTITVKENDSRTQLTLSQNYSEGTEKNDFAYINCCTCWVFFLTNLKSVLEHGHDLRETLVDDESLVNR